MVSNPETQKLLDDLKDAAKSGRGKEFSRILKQLLQAAHAEAEWKMVRAFVLHQKAVLKPIAEAIDKSEIINDFVVSQLVDLLEVLLIRKPLEAIGVDKNVIDNAIDAADLLSKLEKKASPENAGRIRKVLQSLKEHPQLGAKVRASLETSSLPEDAAAKAEVFRARVPGPAPAGQGPEKGKVK